ncbi:MAG: metal-dependent transcriptional regulator [Oscillospiraceae bacterium]|nr:metal-dependent transcriptional regulator [Oscillospiraceae bacterium]
MAIYESGEDYLETILLLNKKTGYVRSIDIATELGYSKPSISRAMTILRSNGYITVESGGKIVLTPMGQEKAEAVYERHVVISKFLMRVLSVNPDTAASDACRMEHIISEESFHSMKAYLSDMDCSAKAE